MLVADSTDYQQVLQEQPDHDTPRHAGSPFGAQDKGRESGSGAGERAEAKETHGAQATGV